MTPASSSIEAEGFMVVFSISRCLWSVTILRELCQRRGWDCAFYSLVQRVDLPVCANLVSPENCVICLSRSTAVDPAPGAGESPEVSCMACNEIGFFSYGRLLGWSFLSDTFPFNRHTWIRFLSFSFSTFATFSPFHQQQDWRRLPVTRKYEDFGEATQSTGSSVFVMCKFDFLSVSLCSWKRKDFVCTSPFGLLYDKMFM